MKILKYFGTLLISLLLWFSSPLQADGPLSIGVGTGSLYSGLGINLAWRDNHSLRYVAAGCVALHYFSGSGWSDACGIGVGWIDTRILPQDGTKHGVGLYFGPVSYLGEHYAMNGTLYGTGLSYQYFYQGISATGWNLGAAIAAGRDERNYKSVLFIQAGYQF
jgi:hypothetical protein